MERCLQHMPQSYNRLAALYAHTPTSAETDRPLSFREEGFEAPRLHWESSKRLLTSHSHPVRLPLDCFRRRLHWKLADRMDSSTSKGRKRRDAGLADCIIR